MDSIIKSFPAQSTRRNVQSHSVLLDQGELPTQAFIVTAGCIKVYRLGRGGDEQIVGFRMPGDFFPETWIFEKTSTSSYYYETLEDSEVITVERDVLLDYIKKHPTLEHELLDYFINSYTGLILQVTALEQSRASDKLSLIMHYLLVRYGKQTSSQSYDIPFHLTHAMLGNLTGLTRETVTVELGKLKDKGVIDYSASSFTIHNDKLQNYLQKHELNDVHIVEDISSPANTL